MDNKQTSQKCSILSTVLCTIALSGNIGNVYRLPQMTIIRGGLPFLVSYSILMIFVGLPLLFLKLGFGQLAQEGILKSWRAVPVFKGVGYVKYLAAYLLVIYYPLFMIMSITLAVSMIKDHSSYGDRDIGVKITQVPGQELLESAFWMESTLGAIIIIIIYIVIIWFIWKIIFLIASSKNDNAPLMYLLLPVVGFFIALITNMALQINKTPTLLVNFLVNDVDWYELSSANTWYFAAIQVFFSTNVGFGLFTTNAGIMYNKVSPLWTALGYILGNLIFGIGSIFITQIYIGHMNVTNFATDIAELKLMTLMYYAAVNSKNTNWFLWGGIYHLFVFVSGFIDLVTLVGQNGIIISFIVGVVAGLGLFIYPDFGLVHLLDHYIVGNLILITVIIEVFVLIAFYGWARIKSDFECMLDHILSKIWIILWCCNPILLIAIFAWALATLPLKGIYKHDPLWMYTTGWGVILISIIFIFVVGIRMLTKQSENTLLEKLKQSLKSLKKWSLTDLIQRRKWIQWNSRSQNS